MLACTITVVSMFPIREEISVDPDQMASTKARWSGFTVFSKQDKPLVQQDNTGFKPFVKKPLNDVIEIASNFPIVASD